MLLWKIIFVYLYRVSADSFSTWRFPLLQEIEVWLNEMKLSWDSIEPDKKNFGHLTWFRRCGKIVKFLVLDFFL